MRLSLATLTLGAAMFTPLFAQGVNVRIYDRDHKDYHNWNDNENRAYNRYLTDQHQERKRDFQKENRDRQRNYWKWRHEHGDDVLFPR